MIRPLELFIGFRYTKAKREHFISFISLISILGLTLGVAALIVVLSVMNGFQDEVREKILGMTSHITVSAYDGKLVNWPEVVAEVEKTPHVTGASPYISGEVMFSYHQLTQGGLLRGIYPEQEKKVSTVDSKMLYNGKLSNLVAGKYRMILGEQLAQNLGVTLGDKVNVITAQANYTVAGILPRYKRFEVVGLFNTGSMLYDRTLALVHMADADKLYRMQGYVHGLHVKTDDLFRAPLTAKDIRISTIYRVQDWSKLHGNYFKAVQIEKNIMFIILTMIVAVAAFNIVATLIMVVYNKRADIAILRTIGMTPWRIMKIFIIQGCLIGFLGTILGLVLGVSIALNIDYLVPKLEQLMGRQIFPSGVYYVDKVPSVLRLEDVSWIAVMAFILTVMATIYPAWKASRTQPVEALRHE